MNRSTRELKEVDARFAEMRRGQRRVTGLRWQILVTLTAVLVATVVLIGLVVLQLSRRNLEEVALESNVAATELLAQAIASAAEPTLPLSSDENRARVSELATAASGGSVSQVLVVDVESAVVADVRREGSVEGLQVLLSAGKPASSSTSLLGTGDSRVRVVVTPIRSASGGVRGAVGVAYTFEALDARTRRSQRLLLLYLLVDALVVFAAGYFMLTRFVVRPVRLLASAIRGVALGDYGRFVEVNNANEMGQLADEFNVMVGEIQKQRGALEEQVEELEQAYGSLELTQQSLIRSEKLAGIGALAAGIAHEVGNPLSAVIGYTDLLADDDLETDERADLVARIDRETRRIDSTIRDLLDYSRAETITVDACPLGESVSQTVDLMKSQPRFREIEFEVELAAGLPLLLFNPGQLQQLLVNLFTNAADAMDDQGRIEVRAHRAEGEPERRVVLTVDDDGPGVPVELRANVFEPFVTSKKAGKGTGLGLAICLSIADSFGGDLSVGESPLGGARFSISLRAAEE